MAAALTGGEIGVQHAEVITRALDEVAPALADEARAEEVERGLVAAAAVADSQRLERECARLWHQVAPELAVAADRAGFEARSLSISRTLGGVSPWTGSWMR